MSITLLIRVNGKVEVAKSLEDSTLTEIANHTIEVNLFEELKNKVFDTKGWVRHKRLASIRPGHSRATSTFNL